MADNGGTSLDTISKLIVQTILNADFVTKTYDFKLQGKINMYEDMEKYNIGVIYDYGTGFLVPAVNGFKEGQDLYSKGYFIFIYGLEGIIQTATGPGLDTTFDSKLNDLKHMHSNLGDFRFLMYKAEDRKLAIERLNQVQEYFSNTIYLVEKGVIDLEEYWPGMSIELMNKIAIYAERLKNINSNYSSPPKN